MVTGLKLSLIGATCWTVKSASPYVIQLPCKSQCLRVDSSLLTHSLLASSHWLAHSTEQASTAPYSTITAHSVQHCTHAHECHPTHQTHSINLKHLHLSTCCFDSLLTNHSPHKIQQRTQLIYSPASAAACMQPTMLHRCRLALDIAACLTLNTLQALQQQGHLLKATNSMGSQISLLLPQHTSTTHACASSLAAAENVTCMLPNA